jgi:FAD/FMN-containing dehydrogenase
MPFQKEARPMQDDRIARLAGEFRGDLVRPADPRYDEVRALYNGMIDKRPRLIARCTDAADVMLAVRFARENALRIAVRGGGHNGAGLGSCDDGLMIDLSRMKGVRVDPGRRTVRAEAGCTQGDVDHAAHAFGLAFPAGIVSTTGLAGLTLGGGHGYLSRAHGLTIDNLLEVDVVLADGRFVTASEREHADLFWALRGGGGNFGVVTSFLYRAHPVRDVYGGPIFWDIAQAKLIMQFYREFLAGAPEALCPFLGLKTVPSSAPFPRELWGRRVCALISCYAGAEAEARAALRPVREQLPKPLLDGMGGMPYPQMQALFDALLPKGLQWYWKGDFVKALPDDAIETHIAHASTSPSELSLMHLYPIDGAVQRMPVEATAWACRDATWSMVIAGIDPDPGKAGALTRWGRAYWEAVHPYNLPGAYVNFMMDDEGEERVRATYGPNYPKLRALKNAYDPDNVFRMNQNIPPAA